jgi:hypothetical protein
MNKEAYIYRHKRRSVFFLSAILLLMMYFFKDASFFLRATTFIAFTVFFYFIDHFFDIRFKSRHYIFIIAIAFFSLLLSPLYFIYPQYDKIQHLIQPMLVSSIIFYMITKLPIKLKWKITFTLFITLGIIGIFEIGEYALDYLFDLKLQGVYLRDLSGFQKFHLLEDPLDDTMIDMVLGFFGAIVYAFFIGAKNIKELKKN